MNHSGTHGNPKKRNTPRSGNKIPLYETTGAAVARSAHSFSSDVPQLPSQASRVALSPRPMRNVPNEQTTKSNVHAPASRGTKPLCEDVECRSTNGSTRFVSHPPSCVPRREQQHDPTLTRALEILETATAWTARWAR